MEMVYKKRKEQGGRIAGGDRCIFNKLSNVSEDLLIVKL